MVLPYSRNVRRYAVAVHRFNRLTPVRYFAIDVAIFGFPLVMAAPSEVGRYTTGLALFSMLAARGGGLVIDDYFDRESDAIENPARPIPAGLVTPTQALGMGIGMLALGLVSAAFVNRTFLLAEIVAYGCLFLSFGVINDLDLPVVSTVGTVTSVSMLSVMGWVVHGSLSAGLLFAFFATWFWDIAHDAVGAYLDHEGDAEAGIQTMGVVFGRKTIADIAIVGLLGSYGVLVTTFARTWTTAAISGLFLVVVVAYVVAFRRGTRSGEVARSAIEWYVIAAYGWTALSVALLGAVIP